MFFTPDLLARRDGGFGLLWLAATLGSKSAFRKLPKRSVMSADIAQLCDLIAEPTEPLALRLSSNLMYGVVRVYKVKQEIFIADVNSCVIALKKMVQEIRQHTVADKDLLLPHPMARPHTVTVQQDPTTSHALMFDVLFSGWDDMDAEDNALESADDNFDPKAKLKKNKGKPAKESIEAARRDAHILNEHHEHLISGSLDMSFEGGFIPGSSGVVLSSAHSEGFGPDDNFLGLSDGFDFAGGLGDELAKELGWEINETQVHVANDGLELDWPALDANLSLELGETGLQFNVQSEVECAPAASTPKQAPQKSSMRDSNKENPIFTSQTVNNCVISVTSPGRISLPRYLSEGDGERRPLADITAENQAIKPERKRKRARLLLDARTELTDEELKVAREKYLESQRALRREIVQKNLEKDATRMIDALIWGVPPGITAEPLVRYWQNNFKVQVQARTDGIEIHSEQEPPRKRARKAAVEIDPSSIDNPRNSPQPEFELGNFDMGLNFDQDFGVYFNPSEEEGRGEGTRKSSEEPGQGRQRSRAPSMARGSQFGFEEDPKGSFASQKSMFPWDNAGGSSSAGHIFSDRMGFSQADIRLRSSSMSQRESPLPHGSQSGSIIGGVSSLSPTRAQGSQGHGRGFAVDFIPAESIEESQRSEVALITLEKNSFNFLEYAKMQHQANPSRDLTFPTIVPTATSTRHVAAAAFYHCLVLATKDLLNLKQQESYGPIVISMV